MQNPFFGLKGTAGFLRCSEEYRKKDQDGGRTGSWNQPDAIPHMTCLGNGGDAEGIHDFSGKPGADEHADAERCKRDKALCRGPQIIRCFTVHIDLSGDEEKVVADAM